jgi:uncharacterized protein (TIGR03435 family)
MKNRRLASSFLVCFSCFAQTPPAFDVASVRLTTPGNVGPPSRTSADSLTMRNISLRNCIQVAYQLPEAQVTGPDWMNDVRLDIVAKAAGPVGEKQLFVMLRTLLAERMGVIAHVERKEVAVYALTLSKGGPKFSETTSEGPPDFSKDKTGTNAKRVSMSEFARVLSQGFGRPFVDATGLKGRYDIRIETISYTAAAPSDAMDGVGIMVTALQEQLGIKVESRKDNVDMLIVDHAEKTPTEN